MMQKESQYTMDLLQVLSAQLLPVNQKADMPQSAKKYDTV